MGILCVGLLAQVFVPGQIVDLVPAAAQSPTPALQYLTSQGELGRIESTGVRTVLLGAGNLPAPAVALSPTPDGSALTVLLTNGDLWRLPSGASAPTQVYSDLYLLQECTDLVIDSAGNHWIAARSISSGVRCVALVAQGGAEWGYFFTQGQPIGLCANPLAPGLLRTDTLGGLRRLTAVDEAPVDTGLGAAPGGSFALLDGDLAAEQDGDVWIASGSAIWRHDQATGQASLVTTLPGTVRGLAILGAPGQSTLWASYGQDPSTVLPVLSTDAAATQIPAAFHAVPNRGVQRLLFGGLNAFDMEAEGLDRLWIGGDDFGSNPNLRRIDLPGFQSTVVANSATGLEGRIEGLSFGADGELLALTSNGVIQRIDRQTGAATTLFADPGDAIVRGKDLALGRFGERFVANYTAFKQGFLALAGAGGAQVLATLQECRGVAADPFRGGVLYSEWRDSGFAGLIGNLPALSAATQPLPGFSGLNYSNGPNWGDGDVLLDAFGRIYTCCEDEFCVKRYDPQTGLVARIASGYLNRPSGLAIARSTPGSGSSTGFSLYVGEWNRIWELPGSPPPAPRWTDLGAPPLPTLRATFTSAQAPVSLCGDPATGLPLVLCTDGSLWRIPLAGQGAPQLLTTLVPTPVAIEPLPDGSILSAEQGGRLRVTQPALGFQTVDLFTDPLNQLSDVCDVSFAGNGALYLLERPPLGLEGGRVWRLQTNTLTLISDCASGRRLAMDPSDGLAVVLEEGRPGEGGELLRLDWQVSPALSGHWRTEPYSAFDQHALDAFHPGAPAPSTQVASGGLALSLEGAAFIAEAATGRLWRLAAQGGGRELLAGQLARPQDLELLGGSPGIAGVQGNSLYAIDGFSLYELGVQDSAKAPIAVPPVPQAGALAAKTDLFTWARRQFGQSVPISIRMPTQVGRPFLCLPSLTGKEPGLPLTVLGDPSDPRVLPQNFDPLLWDLLAPPLFSGFIGVLDNSGTPTVTPSVLIPNLPGLLGLGRFVDLVVVTFAPTAQSGIGAISNTACLYLGP